MRTRLFSLICGALLGGLIPVGAQTVARSPFEGDTRLSQNVRIQAEGIPVSELLRQLSAKTGVTLSAATDIGQEKVIVFSPPRSLRTTLEDLAALFNNQWIASTEKASTEKTKGDAKAGKASLPAYTFYRTRRALENEAALAERKERFALEKMEQQVRALRESPAQLERRQEDDPIRVHLSDSSIRLATEIYALLDTAQRKRLVTRGYLPPIALRSLPPGQQAMLRASMVNRNAEILAQFKNQPENEPGEDNPSPAEIARNLAASQAETLKSLESGFLRFRYDNASASVTVEMPGQALSVGQFLPEEIEFRQGNPYTGTRNPRTLALKGEADLPALKQIAHWTDRLKKLSEVTGRPIFSDYYRVAARSGELAQVMQESMKMMQAEFSSLGIEDTPAAVEGEAKAESAQDTPLTKPGGAQAKPEEDVPAEPPTPLDLVCEQDKHHWWPRGKSLLFRHTHWYRLNRYEPPDAWSLDMARQLHAQQGVPTYQEIGSVLQLTPQQVEGLNLTYGASLIVGGLSVPQSLAFGSMQAAGTTPGLMECLALFRAAVPNTRLALPPGESPMQAKLRDFSFESLFNLEAKAEELQKQPAVPAAPLPPGTLRAAELPPQAKTRLLDFLQAQTWYDAEVDPSGMTLRAAYQIGSSRALNSQNLLTGQSEMMRGLKEAMEGLEEPDENVPPEEQEARMQKYQQVMGDYMRKALQVYEQRMKSVLSMHTNYDDMEKNGYDGQRFVVVWFTTNGAGDELSMSFFSYNVCLPLALADDRRDRTQIEVMP